jgi:hypothetical protein
MTDFGVFVLTIEDDIHSKPILSLMSSALDFTTHILKGFTPGDLGCDSTCMGHGSSQELSCVEFAISEGHRKMRNIARNYDFRAYLFLEDDALPHCSIKSLSNLINDMDTLSGSSKEYAIHLFPEQNGLLAMRSIRNIIRVYLLPDYAVSYVFSKKTLKGIEVQDHLISNSVADWPKYIRKLNWYSPGQSFFIHPDVRELTTRSTTKIDRKNRQATQTFTQKYLNPYSYLTVFLPLFRSIGREYGINQIESSKLRSACIGFPFKRTN